MHLPDIELHEATTLQEAFSLLTSHAPNARLLAGGTDLLVDLKSGRVAVEHVISINRIEELRGISADESGLRIGALTTPAQLAASPVVKERFAAVLDATRDMAAPQVRSMATVGGNIASAIPSADLPPILIVLKASVVLWSEEGERTVPLESFFLGPRQSVCRQHEVLTAIIVPDPPPGSGAAYARLALRDGSACAVAGVAASVRVDEDPNGLESRPRAPAIREAAIALCAVAPTPKPVESAAAALVGANADEVGTGSSPQLAEAAAAAMEAAVPISDVRASSRYRREMVGVLTRRALMTACRRVREKRP